MNWFLNKRIIPLHTMSDGDGDGDGGGGGGGDETWQSKLPEDLKSNETLAQFKDDENSHAGYRYSLSLCCLST